MLKEKDCIEYALHAYDTCWEYYNKTLDERNQILNNYMIFVGIPTSIGGIFIEKIKDIKNYHNWVILFLSIILLLGVVIYDTYVIESFVSQRYLQQIKHITEYLVNNFDQDYLNVFRESYKMDNLLLDDNNSQKQRINKSFIIIIVNTMIMITLYSMILKSNIRWYYIIFPIVVSIAIHTIIFIYQKQHL